MGDVGLRLDKYKPSVGSQSATRARNSRKSSIAEFCSPRLSSARLSASRSSSRLRNPIAIARFFELTSRDAHSAQRGTNTAWSLVARPLGHGRWSEGVAVRDCAERVPVGELEQLERVHRERLSPHCLARPS